MQKQFIASVLFFFLCTMGNGLYGQKNVDIDVVKSQYVYLLTNQRDSLDVENKSEEYFILQRGKEKSQFMSLNSYKRDSVAVGLVNNSVRTSTLDLTNIPKTNFTYRIIKDPVKNKIDYYDKIIRMDFSYEENPGFNWKITSEKKNIGTLKCQAAILKYAGRNYKAWFTNDIPVSDGPYKFYGLPGLIVEMEDDKKHYKFELLSYKNFADEKPLWISEKRMNGKKVPKADFYKGLKNSQENLVQEMAKSGFKLDAGAESLVKDKLKKRNNPIELIP
ncbi:GLPGLI family protein [Chryseobacterium joostei]|uniref:GLPGLI family protein n=1 Tax=Chryseobacterium joostei TaxID=112234 RepID=UPI0023F13AB2|nr:GLPGLI family protein [Chryseobacterium joostei]